mgnify:CR=1 FL=1
MYTISAFQNHPEIDKIAVVCVKGWEDEVEGYREKYGLTKLCRIIRGGDTSMKSIAKGVFGVKDLCEGENNVLIIHDSVRPLIDAETISAASRKVTSHPLPAMLYALPRSPLKNTVNIPETASAE